MDAAKRKALKAAGWKIGDAADFLEMSAEERQLLDTRVEVALAIRRQRKAQKAFTKGTGIKAQDGPTADCQDRTGRVGRVVGPARASIHGGRRQNGCQIGGEQFSRGQAEKGCDKRDPRY